MVERWQDDPRLAKWKRAVQLWRKNHGSDDLMPITPSEVEELEEIFPADKRFYQHSPGRSEIVIFGDPHLSQRMVVCRGIRTEKHQG